jgi:hypothetical protein
MVLIVLNTSISNAQTQNIFNAYSIGWSDNIFEIDSTTKRNLENLQQEMYIDPENPNYDISGYGLSFWIAFADFDNDGEDELLNQLWSHPESYWVYGIYDFDSSKQKWVLNPALTIYGQGDANSRFGKHSLGDFNGDGNIDILRETANFHGRRGQQPSWYLENGDHTPNEIFLNRLSSFERVELDTTKAFDNYCNCEDYLNTTENGVLIDIDQDGKDEAIIVYNSQIQDSVGNAYLAKRYDYENGEIIGAPYIKDESGQYSLGIEFLEKKNGFIYYHLSERVYWNFDKNQPEVFDPSITYQDSVVWAEYLYLIKSSITDGIVLDTTKAILKLDPSYGWYLRHYIADFNQNSEDEVLINLADNEDGRKSNTYIFENGINITNQILHEGYESLMTANASIIVEDINNDGWLDLTGDMGWGRLGQFPGDTEMPEDLLDRYKTFSEIPQYSFPETAGKLPYVPTIHLNQNGKLVPHELIFDEEFQRYFYGTGFVPFVTPSTITTSGSASPELMVSYRRNNGPGSIEEDSRTGMIFIDIKFESMITVSNERLDVSPKSFSLSQNYPNPFNPSTTIQYTLPEVAIVRLEVFNMLGQSVGVLVDGVQQAGSHSVTFDASGLSTGVYFYRLDAPGFTKTRQMLLVK